MDGEEGWGGEELVAGERRWVRIGGGCASSSDEDGEGEERGG